MYLYYEEGAVLEHVWVGSVNQPCVMFAYAFILSLCQLLIKDHDYPIVRVEIT